MAAPVATPLAWLREEPGIYSARGRYGNRWRIAQVGSHSWEVYSDGSPFASWPATLAEAKWAAEEEDDPQARDRRDRRAAKRVARNARASSRRSS